MVFRRQKRILTAVAATMMLAAGCGAESPAAEEPIVRVVTTTEAPTTEPSSGETPSTEPTPDSRPPVTDPEQNESPDTTIIIPLPTTPSDPAERLPEQIRINSYLNFQIPDAEDFNYVLSGKGDVLHIRNGNIFAGAQSYRTWNIGRDGFRQIYAKMDELGLLERSVGNIFESTAPALSISIDGRFVMEAHGLDLPASEMTPEQAEIRDNIKQLIAHLEDMSWLENVEPTTPSLWVPNHMTVYARDENDPRYYTTERFAWPFDATIEEMSFPPDEEGERVVCLAGAEAATAWRALMIDGVNHARLPVNDGSDHELTIRVSYPGYQLYGDRCAGATNVGNVGSATIGTDIPSGSKYNSLLEPLFLTEEHFPSSWRVDLPGELGPAPNIQACPSSPGDSEAATNEFDSWLQERINANGIENSRPFHFDQIVGVVPQNVNPESVIAGIANYDDCPDPFKELGVDQFESGFLPDTPDGIRSGAYWILNDGESVIADIVLDNRIAVVISFSTANPDLTVGHDLMPWINDILDRVAGFEAHLALCTSAATIYQPGTPIGYLAGCDGIAEYLGIEDTWTP